MSISIFPQGYIISDTNIDHEVKRHDVISSWKRISTRRFFIYYDNKLKVNIYQKGNDCILVLGTMIDPETNINQIEIIQHTLYSKLLISKRDFFDYYNTLSGRFVCLVSVGEVSMLLHDAMGTRSVFYYIDKNFLVSGHFQLIAELTNKTICGDEKIFLNSQVYKNKNVKYFPGIKTPYKGIYTLTPNTYLNLNSLKIVRFYPNEKYIQHKELSDKDFNRLIKILENTIELFSKDYNLTVSLTGGLDSRTTLSACKNIKDLLYCYTFKKSKDNDSKFDAQQAENIAKRFDLDHKVVSLEVEGIENTDKKFIEMFKRSTGYMRSDSQGYLAREISKNYPDNYLELKSIIEVGKAFYQVNYPPQIMINKFLYRLFSKIYGIKNKFTLNSFKEYFEITDFKCVKKYKYPIYDLFYWEHRLGCWQNLQNSDFDFFRDMVVPFNNRVFFDIMLKISTSKRLSHDLQIKMINKLWSELLDIPVNPWTKLKKRATIVVFLWKIYDILTSPFLSKR